MAFHPWVSVSEHFPGLELPLIVLPASLVVQAMTWPCFKLLYIAEGQVQVHTEQGRRWAMAPALLWLGDRGPMTLEGAFQGEACCFLPEIVHGALALETLHGVRPADLPLSSRLDLFWVEPFLSGGLPPCCLLSPLADRAVRDGFQKLHTEWQQPDAPLWPCRTRAQLIELLFLTARLLSDTHHEPSTADPACIGQDSPLVEQVLLHLHTHLADPLTLDRLAHLHGTNRTTLQQAFSAATGKTLGRYLRDLRMSTARALLAETRLPIEQIAERTGFPDSGYFARVFRNVHGLSPRAFRAQAQG